MKRYFETYRDALAYIRNAGLTGVKPFKSEKYIYPGFEMVWTVKHD